MHMFNQQHYNNKVAGKINRCFLFGIPRDAFRKYQQHPRVHGAFKVSDERQDYLLKKYVLL